MTTQTETGVRAKVREHIGNPNDQTPATVGDFIEKLRAHAGVVGVDVENIPFEQGVKAVDDAIGALEQVGSKAAPTASSDLRALRDHLGAQQQALSKLEALQALVTGEPPPNVALQSVVELCNFSKLENGVRELTIPPNMDVIKIFELANVEAARLGINPAVYAGDLDWYRKNTSAGVAQTSAREVSVIPLAKGSLGKSREYQESKFTFPDIELSTLANVLEWIESKGKVDSFDGNWVRTNAPGVALDRDSDGVLVYRLDGNANVNVGCSAVPN